MKIAVLMSVYNGAQYITEQIESILNQKGVEVVLFIRDDGSKDETKKIIREYEKTHNNIVFINADNRINLGPYQSFFALLEYADKYIHNINLFAFADQDDVWLEKKLYAVVELIARRVKKKTLINELPIVYYSRKIWTDKDLHIIRTDSSTGRGDFFDLFSRVPVYGCTMVINRNMLCKIISGKKIGNVAHDLYIARLAESMKESIIIPDQNAYILYRRHGNNYSDNPSKLNVLKAIKNKVKNKNQYHAIKRYIIEIVKNNESDLGDEQKKVFDWVLGYEKNFSKKIKLLFYKEAWKRGPKETIIWVGRVMFNAI